MNKYALMDLDHRCNGLSNGGSFGVKERIKVLRGGVVGKVEVDEWAGFT